MRFLISEEFRKGASLNEQLVKMFRDGLPMENEVMFGTSQTIDLTCKLFFTANNTLIFDPDGGMTRGYREIEMKSRFVEDYATSEYNHEPLCFQADKTFPPKFEQAEYRDELIHILIEYSHKYYKDGLITPKSISDASQQTCEMQGDQFKTFFETYYALNPYGEVFKADLSLVYQNEFKKPLDLLTIKDEFKKISHNIVYDRNKKGTGEDKDKRGCFLGIKKV
jgi:hypothetical protein